jgi:hypothetical protein
MKFEFKIDDPDVNKFCKLFEEPPNHHIKHNDHHEHKKHHDHHYEEEPQDNNNCYSFIDIMGQALAKFIDNLFH